MATAARHQKPDAVNAEVQRAYEQLCAGYRAQPNPSLAERLDRLDRLEQLIIRNKEEFVSAADADFGGRARHESLTAEVVLSLEGTRDAKRHLREWLRPQPAATMPAFVGSTAWVESLPKGVVGVLAPWNYPVNLVLVPMASALAAGNRVLAKPSELTPRVSAALAKAVRDLFTAEEVAVLEGGPDVAAAITHLPLGHLFFTGSTRVGKIVARAAAENLVPVTLELGGKCPVLVHADFPVATAAERVATAKIFNSGQTCLAPDYVLLPEGKQDVFVDAFRSAVKDGWPDLPSSPNYTSLVNDAAFARQQSLLADAVGKGAKAVAMAPAADGRKLAPVLLLGVNDSMRVMQEEIFGPLLPVIGYRDLGEAEAQIAKNPQPLAFYIFDQNEDRARETMARIPSGGACINDTMAHFAQDALPFGGLGASGMGAYHGKAGFLTFSHQRGVLAVNPLSPAKYAFGASGPKVLDRATDLLSTRLGGWVMDKLNR
jgi:coniferyl-aldehyde dehydrogenase